MLIPANAKPVAYFCNEFAIDSDLPTYAGGLGVLAGDLMKEAADQDYPFVGVGILYKGKHFIQHITGDGREEKRDSQFDHDTSFLRQTYNRSGSHLEVKLELEGKEVIVKSYHLRLSDNCVLFFLSTDVDGNPQEWINDMDALYRGDTDSLIRQQILLGVGGVRVLEELGIKPRLYHINEGRPEFLIWEVVSKQVGNGKNFEEAWKEAKEKIVYTNHTLVSAGNLEYSLDRLKYWAKFYADRMGVETDKLVEDGKKDDKFSITKYALGISEKQSGVSKVHAKHAEKEWPGFKFIAITNGVHMPTWQDSDFRDPNITDRQMWDLHMLKKKELAKTVLARTGYTYDHNRLVVSWARRLASYKQPLSIFEDIQRLKKILSNQNGHVQLLFAGNSHSADPSAKAIIEKIIDYMGEEISGHAIFVPNYNTSLANHLVSGSDIWLNTPKGNLEACGTSGMKAAANGVINCTVIDGWTNEVDWDGAGWVLEPDSVAKSFYRLMEDEILPTFYKRDSDDNLSSVWLKKMRKSIDIAKKYSTKRMMDDYKKKLYEEG